MNEQDIDVDKIIKDIIPCISEYIDDVLSEEYSFFLVELLKFTDSTVNSNCRITFANKYIIDKDKFIQNIYTNHYSKVQYDRDKKFIVIIKYPNIDHEYEYIVQKVSIDYVLKNIKISKKIKTKPKYDTLVISGGGTKSILTLGVVHDKFTDGTLNLENIETYAGTSSGSMICLLLNCGYEPIDIFIALKEMDDIFDVKDTQKIEDIIKFMGIMSMQKITDKLYRLVYNKFKEIPTMKKLHELTGKNLVIVSTNITRCEPVYFSHKSSPELSCIDAVRMSCNVPLLFPRIIYQKCYMSDGGLSDNFPITYVDNSERKIFGITLRDDMNTFDIRAENGDINLSEYISKIMMCPIKSTTTFQMGHCSENVKVIEINRNLPFINFSLSAKEKMIFFSQGIEISRFDNNIKRTFIKDWKDPILL